MTTPHGEAKAGLGGWRNHASSLRLLAGVLVGAAAGALFRERAVVLKPVGDIFLNLLLTAVVPLVFFSVSSAIAGMREARRLTHILGWMMFFFVLTNVAASGVMLGVVRLFPVGIGATLSVPVIDGAGAPSAGEALVRTFSVSDFPEVFSKRNMMALIVFAVLVGFAAARAGEAAAPVVRLLESGSKVMSRAVSALLSMAPVGLGAYFAYLVGVFGPQLMGSYWRVVQVYYPAALFYFVFVFSACVFWAGGWRGVTAFWRAIPVSAFTALATGSSVATIPANLDASQRLGVAEDVREVVIPLGATLHSEGSCLAAVVKIAFLFGVYHMPFAGPETLLKALLIAVLCGTVISGIPSGGVLGELIILTLYGFPPEALPLITVIGTIVDPPATMLNAVGDTVTGLMVARGMRS